MDELERDQQRATETKGMEHLTHEPSQKARSVQPGEERLRGGSYLHLKRGCKEDMKQAPFSGPQRIEGNGHKMKHKKFHLNIRKNFFTLRVIKYWKKLSREVEGRPTL